MTTNHDREQAGSAGEDSAVTRAWRRASDEQPPAQLDDAILDAARRSVAADDEGATTRRVQPRTRKRWMQWQPLAAAATVAGLAFVLLQTLPREREVAPPIRIQAPAPASSAEREVAPEAQGGAPELARAPDVSPESRRSGIPASGIIQAPSDPGTGPLLRALSEEDAARSSPAEAAGVVDAMRPAETDRRKGLMTDAAGTDWATRIEALHASGDFAAAAAALREFRAVDPDADARLPESLRKWARTVE